MLLSSSTTYTHTILYSTKHHEVLMDYGNVLTSSHRIIEVVLDEAGSIFTPRVLSNRAVFLGSFDSYYIFQTSN